MRIRFLRTTASDRPEFPFAAGQVIHVDHLRSHMRKWLREGDAELLPEPATEVAVQPEATVERAVLPKPIRRGRDETK